MEYVLEQIGTNYSDLDSCDHNCLLHISIINGEQRSPDIAKRSNSSKTSSWFGSFTVESSLKSTSGIKTANVRRAASNLAFFLLLPNPKKKI